MFCIFDATVTIFYFYCLLLVSRKKFDFYVQLCQKYLILKCICSFFCIFALYNHIGVVNLLFLSSIFISFFGFTMLNRICHAVLTGSDNNELPAHVPKALGNVLCFITKYDIHGRCFLNTLL